MLSDAAQHADIYLEAIDTVKRDELVLFGFFRFPKAWNVPAET